MQANVRKCLNFEPEDEAQVPVVSLAGEIFLDKSFNLSGFCVP